MGSDVSAYVTAQEHERLKERLAWWRGFALVGWFLFGLAVVLFTMARPVRASAQSPETRAAANADRQQFPSTDWPYLYYLTTDALGDVRQLAAGRTAAFTLSSFSRAVVLEQHVPIQVAPGLYRIDLRGLQWSYSDWTAVLEAYPYAPESRPLPLIVRADWLVVRLSDNFESDSGYRLLYGGKSIPKTRAEFLKLWNIPDRGVQDPLLMAHVEQASGVSLLHVRRIQNLPAANRGYAWGTEDVAQRNFNAATDPLEHLIGGAQHDAEEWIVGFPKQSVTQGAAGMAQGYLLSNGKGVRQDRAPVDIVEDHTRFRGVAEIRNSGSCIQCHAEGIKPLNENGLREIIASGVELFADKKSQQIIEQQNLVEARLKIEVVRAQEDYAAFVALATGWDVESNARAFRELVDTYDKPLTLEDCARELYVTPQDLEHALGYASSRQVKLGARLAGLAHDQTITRPYFESQYSTAYAAVKLWQQVGK